MRSFILLTVLAAWLVMAFSVREKALAGAYHAAGSQLIQSPVNLGKNGSGYRIQMCTTAQACAFSTTAAKKFTIQIGILGDDAPKQTAAQLWAIYE